MPRRKSSPELPDPEQMPPGTPVFQYARDSGGARQEKSVADQLQDLDTRLAARGWVLAGRFADVARRGGDAGRAEFNRLLATLDERPVRARVVQSFDYKRLARDEGLGLELLAHCYRAGVPIDSLINPVPAPVRTIVEPLMFYLGAEESRQMGRAVERGMSRMIEHGCAPGGFPPIGYMVEYVDQPPHRDGSPRRWPCWIHDPAREEEIALAWRMRLELASYSSIQTATPGIARAKSSLATMFHNPAYSGFPRWYLRHAEVSIVDCIGHEPIIPPYVSVSEFLRVQEMTGDNPRCQFGGWPLGGLITCGYCGGSVWAWAYTHARRCDVCSAPWTSPTPTCPACGADYSHRYGVHRYFCSNHQADARRCPQSRYAAGQRLERHLVQELARQFTPARMIEMIGGLNTALAAQEQAAGRARAELEEELRKVEGFARELLRAVEAGGASTLLLQRLQEREQEIAALRVRLGALQVPAAPLTLQESDAVTLAAFVQDDLPALPRRELREFFRTLDLRVTLYNERAVASVPWPPLRLLVPTLATGSFVPPGGRSNDPVAFPLPMRIEFAVAV